MPWPVVVDPGVYQYIFNRLADCPAGVPDAAMFLALWLDPYRIILGATFDDTLPTIAGHPARRQGSTPTTWGSIEVVTELRDGVVEVVNMRINWPE